MGRRASVARLLCCVAVCAVGCARSDPPAAELDAEVVGFRACCDESGRPLVDRDAPLRLQLDPDLEAADYSVSVRTAGATIAAALRPVAEGTRRVWVVEFPDETPAPGPISVLVQRRGPTRSQSRGIHARWQEAPQDQAEIRRIVELRASGKAGAAYALGQRVVRRGGVRALWASLEMARTRHGEGGDVALSAWRQSAEIAASLGYRSEAARRLRSAAFVALGSRRYDEANALLEEAADVPLPLQDFRGVADQRFTEGLVSASIGRHNEALLDFRQALTFGRLSEHAALLCEPLARMANSHAGVDSYDLALELLEEERRCRASNATNDKRAHYAYNSDRSWFILRGVEAGALPESWLEEARDHAATAVVLAEGLGDAGDLGNTLTNYGYALWLLGDHGQALDVAERALEVLPARHFAFGFARLLQAVCLRDARPADVRSQRLAIRKLEALAAAGSDTVGGDDDYAAETALALAKTFQMRGETTRAQELFKRSLTLSYRQGGGVPVGEARARFFRTQQGLLDSLVAAEVYGGRARRALSLLDSHQQQVLSAYQSRQAAAGLRGESARGYARALGRFQRARDAEVALKDHAGFLAPAEEAQRQRAVKEHRQSAADAFAKALALLQRGRAASASTSPLPALAHDEAALAIHRVDEGNLRFWLRDGRVSVGQLSADEDFAKALPGGIRHVFVSAADYSDALSLPFQTNKAGEALIDRVSVSFVPSLGWLTRTRAEARRSGRGMHVLADPLSDLAGARQEGRWLERMGVQQHLVGPAATGQRLLQSLATAERVHYAGHAVGDPGDPWQSGLLTHGRTTFVRDLLAGGCGAALVVLSACDTGAHLEPSRRRGVNLAEALLLAGARTVVATRRPLPDGAGLPFVQDFYRALHQDALPAMAARRSALGRRRAGDGEWDAFVVFGERRL